MKLSLTLLAFSILFTFSLSVTGQQLLNKTISIDGLAREYLLYLPEAYDGSETWALVLNLHGYQGNGASQAGVSQMNAVADTAHFLVAYPSGKIVDISDFQAPGSPLPPQATGWNLGGFLSENDDVAFLEQMTDQIAAEYTVNTSHIYATGLSQGGQMTYMLACTLNGRFAAIASVAGSQATPEGIISIPCEPASLLPVLHIHGTNDNIVPYQGSTYFLGAQGSVDFWRNHNNCEEGFTEFSFPDINTTDQSTVTAIRYDNCDDDTEVWLYRVNGGGHWWPGGSPLPPGWEALGPVNRDINASAEIWNFFNRHSLITAAHELSPSEIALRSYPNPVFDQLIFEFELPEAAMVTITLYNPLGQPLQVLANEMRPAGQQQITWRRPVSMPDGLYYYRLQVDERMVSKAVVLGR